MGHHQIISGKAQLVERSPKAVTAAFIPGTFNQEDDLVGEIARIAQLCLGALIRYLAAFTLAVAVNINFQPVLNRRSQLRRHARKLPLRR